MSFNAPKPEPKIDPVAEEDDFVKQVKERKRKALLARGREVPPSPPPVRHGKSDPLATELLQAGGEVIYEKFAICVIKHACGTKITKFHDRNNQNEPKVMKFIAENTSIPVPRVYEATDRHVTMDYVPKAMDLQAAWEKHLSENDRALIRSQMRDYITQLHNLKSPNGTICSFDGGPIVDSRLFLHEGGPFPNEAAYNDFLVSDLGGGDYASISNMIRKQLRDNHEIVFIHGDLHGINILVRPGDGVVAIIDWELAGYYPEYIDFVKLYRPFLPDCGYYRELHDIFPKVFEAEFAIDSLINVWVRH